MRVPHILISTGGGDPENYMRAITLAGGAAQACYCPPPEVAHDGLLLAGGGDIDPALIREENCGSYEIDRRRDEAELALIKAYLKAERPILGICRGHQMVNIALGGKLWQDIGEKLLFFHQRAPHEGAGDITHRICTEDGSQLWQIFSAVAEVNSIHHQAMKTPGEGMVITAWSESGLMEGTEHETLPILTVQFHPERMENGGGVFDWFLSACGLNQKMNVHNR